MVGERITEHGNPASVSLDTKSTRRILSIINREDHKVAPAVRRALSGIARAVDLAADAIARGGRMVYMGAGTSGRLGVLDAAECIPTFGTTSVVALLAGAPKAMFEPVEGSEDSPQQAGRDLRGIKFNRKDVLLGISASGRTPYTLAGLRHARRAGARTVALVMNPGSEMARAADVPIEVVTGPEVISGSTRMKSGTAQKLVLNMISTATMVRLGRVYSNLMVNVQLTNAKLRRRALDILRRETGAGDRAAAWALRQAEGRLPVALLMLWKRISEYEAAGLLRDGQDTAAVLRKAKKKGEVRVKRQEAKGKRQK